MDTLAVRSTTSSELKQSTKVGGRRFMVGGGQICFECRADMPDYVFSENYIKLLRITIAVEFSKQTSGRRMTNEVVARVYVTLRSTRHDATPCSIWVLKTLRSASEVRFT